MLLLTDRSERSAALRQTVQVIEPCAVVTIGKSQAATSDHSIIICDVDLGSTKVLQETREAIARHRVRSGIPLLHLSRQTGPIALAQAQEIDATAVMPHDTTPAQILFTVRRLVEARRPASCVPVPPIASVAAANIQKAGSVYLEVLDALRRGERISAKSLERGSNAVIAAVGGGRISAWLDVVQAYDDISYQHSLLVAGFIVAFAMRSGVSLEGQRLVGKAALLHDVGKLHIPREILNKPGRLTPAEMDIVRTHPTVGHRMLLLQGGFDERTLDMVLHHHEYLDGSGYPEGLQGDAISPRVRMMTICDIYAALVERRSYKEPMSSQAALAILSDMEGKLDQGLIKAFRAMVQSG